jgi:hypothetical protein
MIFFYCFENYKMTNVHITYQGHSRGIKEEGWRVGVWGVHSLGKLCCDCVQTKKKNKHTNSHLEVPTHQEFELW